MSDTATRPAPGWYADPKNATQARWWNGAGWSETTRPLPGAVPASATTPAPAMAATAVSATAASVAPAVPAASSAYAPTPAHPAAPVSPYATNAPAPAAHPHPDLPSSPAAWSRDPAQRSLADGYSAMSSYVPEVVTVGSANTVPGWLMATAPLWAGGSIFVAVFLLVVSNPELPIDQVPRWAWGLISAIPMVALAAVDAHQLKKRGYEPPNPALAIVLTPWLYLGARGKEVRRRGRKMWPMELTFVICFVLAVGAGAAAVFGGSALEREGARIQAASIRHQAEQELDKQVGSTWTLTCMTPDADWKPSSTIACTATAADGRSENVNIVIAADGTVTFAPA
ncbi:hypothetical protein GCM10027515_08790 [Schumannella luteola]|uniref:DUF2510 domain-containing protein n=1 Tax=Schumannella luteola TaxID=472059 RepID=A0A852Y6R3_9MICO|nr:hypothetical protein [Schumannella luteola]